MDTWTIISIVGAISATLTILYLVTYFWLAEIVAHRSGILEPDKVAAFKDSFLKTLAQIIGGLAVVATFSWTLIKDSRTLHQDSIRQANQQYVDAVKLIAEKRVEISAAGVYSMKRLVEAYPVLFVGV